MSIIFCSVLVVSNIIIVCICNDGLVIGSDSLGVSGALIGNRVLQNVYQVNSNTIMCCAEGQADFHHLFADIKSFVRTADTSIYSVQSSISRSSSVISTTSIAKYARRLANKKYRKTHFIIAGVDEYINDNNNNSNGDNINASVSYSVHEVLPGGNLVTQPFGLAGYVCFASMQHSSPYAHVHIYIYIFM